MASHNSTFAASLRDSVLRDITTVANADRTAGPGLRRREDIYILPPSATSEDRGNFLQYLIMCGQSQSRDRGKWRTFVLTVIHAAFPDIGSAIITGQSQFYLPISVSPGDLQALGRVAHMLLAWEDLDENDKEQNETARESVARELPTLSNLPEFDANAYSRDSNTSAQIEALYGWVSIVFFLAGKTITEQNRGAVTDKRPLAVERKYNLGTVACLTGRHKLSDVAHECINNAFVSLTSARAVLFRALATGIDAQLGAGMDAAAVTIRLMRYMGMQHVILIDKFLSAVPEAARAPVLASSLVAYSNSLRALRDVPPAERPFYKLIHGDTTRHFHRKDVEALMITAIHYEKQTNPTLANYNLPENAAQILKAYNNHLAAVAGSDNGQEDDDEQTKE